MGNMARNIRVTDVSLYELLKRTMLRSLRQTVLMRMFAQEKSVPIRFHGHKPNEPVNYCMICEEEVFNIFFVKGSEKKNVVHCLRCALQVNKDLTGWICLEEYDIEELKTVYDNFVLGNVRAPSHENPLQLSLVNNNSNTSTNPSNASI